MPTAFNPDVLWDAIVKAAGPGAELVLFSDANGKGRIVARTPLTGPDFDFGNIPLHETVGSVGILSASGETILHALCGNTAGSIIFDNPM